jgi:hypothetical protein
MTAARAPRHRYSYDPACATLAHHFLDDCAGTTDGDLDDLAQTLQDACEDACRAVEERTARQVTP